MRRRRRRQALALEKAAHLFPLFLRQLPVSVLFRALSTSFPFLSLIFDYSHGMNTHFTLQLVRPRLLRGAVAARETDTSYVARKGG